jgi:hypothetical protein
MRTPILISALLTMALHAEPIKLHSANPHYYLFHGQPTILITSAEHYGGVVNKVAGAYHGRSVDPITISDLLKDLEADYIDRGCSSLPTFRCFQKHLIPVLGNIRVSKFGTSDLNEYKRIRLADITAHGGTNTTINREIQKHCGLHGTSGSGMTRRK